LQLLASSLPSLSWDESLLRLALAAVLGGLIGVERELRDREAGLRTHLLVGLGSAAFTIVGAYGFHDFLEAGGAVVRTDPTRIAAQIVTGIGFLGAGAIIRQGWSVRGLTTAATLWVVASVGMAAGAGYYSAAVITTGVVLVALWPLRILAYRIVPRFRDAGGRLLVALPAGESPGAVVDAVEGAGARIGSIDLSQEGGHRRLVLEVALPRDTPATQVVARVADIELVHEVRWDD
jgi:putative Mg2+ transporter-C (MgtC) family protein